MLGGRDEIAPGDSLLLDAERAAHEGRRRLAALTLAAAVEALAGAGGDMAPSLSVAMTLRKRALSGEEIGDEEIREALRVTRRARRSQRAQP